MGGHHWGWERQCKRRPRTQLVDLTSLPLPEGGFAMAHRTCGTSVGYHGNQLPIWILARHYLCRVIEHGQ